MSIVDDYPFEISIESGSAEDVEKLLLNSLNSDSFPPMYTIDENAAVIWCNKRFLDLVHLEEKDCQGRTLLELGEGCPEIPAVIWELMMDDDKVAFDSEEEDAGGPVQIVNTALDEKMVCMAARKIRYDERQQKINMCVTLIDLSGLPAERYAQFSKHAMLRTLEKGSEGMKERMAVFRSAGRKLLNIIDTEDNNSKYPAHALDKLREHVEQIEQLEAEGKDPLVDLFERYGSDVNDESDDESNV